MSQIECPDQSVVDSFVNGRLDDERMASIAAHLDTCTDCQAKVESEFAGANLARAMRAESFGTARIGVHEGTSSQEAFRIPDRLGQFRVLKLLGEGGMGQVFLAEDGELQRLVAVKVLKSTFASDTESKRFQLEAEAAARLNHPNIVPIHGAGEDGGRRFLTMAYIEGQSLAQRLAGGPLPPRNAAKLMQLVAEAVEHAHSQGVVHRDLKPGNILLDRKEQPLVSDFGLAKRSEGDSSMTRSGQVVGTPSFMPPEQARGANDEVGAAADVYSIGATMYCALTGRPPFQAATVVETLRLVLDTEPVSPRALNPLVPRDLDTICMKCLEKKPEHRYPSALATSQDLQRFLDDRPILARPVGPGGRLVRWSRRNPLLSASLAAAVAILLTAFAIVSWSLAEEAKQRAAADEAKGDAQAKEKEERWSRYLANISAASSALQLHNVGAARRFLEDAPEEHRGWEWRHFSSQLDDSRLTIRGHTGQVRMVLFRPDGRQLASAGKDDTVRLTDPVDGKELHVLECRFGIDAMAYSKDGARIAAGSRRGLMIWDAATGRVVSEVPEGEANTAVIPLGPVAAHELQYVYVTRMRFIDAATGETVHTSRHDEDIVEFDHSYDRKRIVTGGKDQTVCLWDARSGERTLKREHSVFLNALAFSPDGTFLASGGGYPDNSIRLKNLETGVTLPPLAGHTNTIISLAYSPDGTRLASAAYDQTVRLWEGATGRPIAALRGHTNWVVQTIFSPDGRHLVSASDDRTMRLWDAATGDFLAVLRGHTGAISRTAFSPDGATLASASHDGTVRLWDVERIRRQGILRGHANFVYAVAFSPNGWYVASTGWDGTLRVWDAGTGLEVAKMSHGKDATVISLAFSADGQHIACYARGTGVHWWDWKAGSERRFALPLVSQDTRVAISVKGDRCAAGSSDGKVHIWDTATGEVVAILDEGTKAGIRDIAFDPSGNRLAAASSDTVGGKFGIRIWDLSRREIIRTLSGHTKLVYSVRFSADNRWLVSGSTDGTARLWDAETFELAAVLTHGGNVYDASFHPDGKRLATACADNTVRLWDLKTFREVAELRGHETYVHSVSWSPDGSRLVTGSGDKTVRIWDAPP